MEREDRESYTEETEARDSYTVRTRILHVQVLAHGEVDGTALLKSDLRNHLCHTLVYVRVPHNAERMKEGRDGESLETNKDILIS